MTRRRNRAGFTLLEAMIAMAILATALTWISVGVIRSLRNEAHAKMLTTAAALARTKMDDFEDELYEKGFGTFEKDIDGNFSEQGFPRFFWKIQVEKVEMPSLDQVQTAMTKANELRSSVSSGTSGSTGGTSGSSSDTSKSSGSDPSASMGGALSALYEPIRSVLEQGIRRVSVIVAWNEGTKRYEMPVVAYYTDVKVVDQTLQLNIPTSIPGMPGGSGGPPSQGPPR